MWWFNKNKKNIVNNSNIDHNVNIDQDNIDNKTFEIIKENHLTYSYIPDELNNDNIWNNNISYFENLNLMDLIGSFIEMIFLNNGDNIDINRFGIYDRIKKNPTK